jgi:hypothetical protein
LLVAAAGLVAAVIPTLTGGQAASASRAPLTGVHSPTQAPNPSDFSGHASNPYFPLRPGTVALLRGHDGPLRLRERVVVTHRTKRIQGVRTRVVSDVVHRLDGSLAEKTLDWYATDKAGRVWYFGERTATYDRHGHVTGRHGSWQAGVKGAVAGTIMPTNPHPSTGFRQEFLRGEAEDQAWIVQRGARAKTPAGRFRDVVRTLEWTRLETDVVSMKFYAPGKGLVMEQDVAGGDERFVLVKVRRP